MNNKIYNIIKKISKLIYNEPTIYLPSDYNENIPSLFLSNHEKNYGPIMLATNFPYEVRPWAHSEVVHYEESFAYIRDTFCIERLKLKKGTANAVAKLIAKPVVGVVNMNNPIPIYHDGARDIRTIRNSLEAFSNYENQLIFASNAEPISINGELNSNFDIYKGYQLIVKQLMRKNIETRIYPVSINKQKSTISIGDYISPNISASWKEQIECIHKYIVEEVKRGYVNPGKRNKSLHTQTAINSFENLYMKADYS